MIFFINSIFIDNEYFKYFYRNKIEVVLRKKNKRRGPKWRPKTRALLTYRVLLDLAAL